MSSKIIAGTTSGTALNMSADTSGQLEIQTGSGPTTAITVDSAQKVGVGTTSPVEKLTVAGAIVSTGATTLTSSSSAGIFDYTSGTTRVISAYNSGGSGIELYTNPSGGALALRAAISSTGVLSFNSGYGSAAQAYGCRAWVKFNGVGTVTIQGSGNVSSVGDNGVGIYAVNFTNSMPDITYAAVASFQVSAWANYQIITYGFQTGGYLIGTAINTSGANVDNDNISSAVFR